MGTTVKEYMIGETKVRIAEWPREESSLPYRVTFDDFEGMGSIFKTMGEAEAFAEQWCRDLAKRRKRRRAR